MGSRSLWPAQLLGLGAVGAVVRNHKVGTGAVCVLVLLQLKAGRRLHDLACRNRWEVHYCRTPVGQVDCLDRTGLLVLWDLPAKSFRGLVRPWVIYSVKNWLLLVPIVTGAWRLHWVELVVVFLVLDFLKFVASWTLRNFIYWFFVVRMTHSLKYFGLYFSYKLLRWMRVCLSNSHVYLIIYLLNWSLIQSKLRSWPKIFSCLRRKYLNIPIHIFLFSKNFRQLKCWHVRFYFPGAFKQILGIYQTWSWGFYQVALLFSLGISLWRHKLSWATQDLLVEIRNILKV